MNACHLRDGWECEYDGCKVCPYFWDDDDYPTEENIAEQNRLDEVEEKEHKLQLLREFLQDAETEEEKQEYRRAINKLEIELKGW